MIPEFKPLPEGYDDFDVCDEVDRALRLKNKQPWTRSVGVYHPSSLACKRNMFYDRRADVPVPITSEELAIIFEIGHATHGWVQNLLQLRDKELLIEEKAQLPTLYVGGTCDGHYVKQGWILEIKSCSPNVFDTLTKPYAYHKEQVHCYMVARGVPRAQIMYVNKATGARKKYNVYYDAVIWQGVLDKIALVETCVEKNELPEREVDYMLCSECKFAYTCNPFEGTKYERKHAAVVGQFRPNYSGSRGRLTSDRLRSAFGLSGDGAKVSEGAVQATTGRSKDVVRPVPGLLRVPDGTDNPVLQPASDIGSKADHSARVKIRRTITR